MEYKLEYKKQLQSRSERVKCVDLHKELPWIVSGLYNGYVNIYDYSTQQLIKTMEICPQPIRSVRFIAQKQWIVVGSDDFMLRLFNQNTFEKIFQVKAHEDYIRDIKVNEDKIITSSDDTLIKIWKIKDEELVLDKTLKEHSHFVMQIALNPKDSQIIASCSLDQTIKIWNINFGKSQITLVGHESGVNCVEYYKGDKPYIISGGDDRLIKIWDYQTKLTIHTLNSHLDNVVFILCHDNLPIILTGSEDNTIKVWGKQQLNYLQDLQFNMERPWSVCSINNLVGLGYDMGTMVLKIGNDQTVIDQNNGKILYAQNQNIFYANLKALNLSSIQENTIIQTNPKQLGSLDLYPNQIRFSPNGHSFSVTNFQEYIIYRTQTFKSQSFGKANNIAFNNSHTDQLFVINYSNLITVIKLNNNQQLNQINVDYQIDKIHGGMFICVQNQDFLIFYNWETLEIIQKIDINTTHLFWNSDYTTLALSNSNNEIFILKLNSEYQFELQQEVSDSIQSGLFIDNIFFYVNQQNKLNYVIDSIIFNVSNVKKGFHLLCYQLQQNKLYFNNQENQIMSLAYPYNTIQFLNYIINEDIESAMDILNQIDKQYIEKMSEFLQKINKVELAYRIVIDENMKFDLAIQLNRIEEAFEIAKKIQNQYKYQILGDMALEAGYIQIAIECYKSSHDLNSLLLIYSSLGLKEEMKQLGELGQQQNKFNIAFICYFLTNQVHKCIDLLVISQRIPEAAVMARSYQPTILTQLLAQWKSSLQQLYPISSQIISDQYHPQELDILISNYQKINHIPIFDPNFEIPAHQYSLFQPLYQQDISLLNLDDPQQYNQIQADWNNPAIQQVHLKENYDDDDYEQQDEVYYDVHDHQQNDS